MKNEISEIDGRLGERLDFLHKEKNYPRNLANLEGFPYKNFVEFQDAVRNKELSVQANPFEISSSVFLFMATNIEARKYMFSLLLTIMSIVVYLITAVLLYNYWILLAAPINYYASGFLSSPYSFNKKGRFILLIVLVIASYLFYVNDIYWGQPIVVGLLLGFFGSSLSRMVYWNTITNRAKELENALVILLWGNLIRLIPKNSENIWYPPLSSDME